MPLFFSLSRAMAENGAVVEKEAGGSAAGNTDRDGAQWQSAADLIAALEPLRWGSRQKRPRHGLKVSTENHWALAWLWASSLGPLVSLFESSPSVTYSSV